MNGQIVVQDCLSPVGSVEQYVARVHQVAVLSLEEEQRLAKRFYHDNDLDAARQLVMAHLRFVVRIAKGYAGYGLSEADLIQEGNIGLMKAVKRFDPTMGVRLVTFAAHWIKSEIHDFVIRNWRIVKVATTKAQRKLFFNLRGLKKHFNWLNADESKDIAADLGVTIKDVQEMEARLSLQDKAFDAPLHESGEEVSFHPAEYLEDKRFDPAHLLEHQQWQETALNQLGAAFDTLNEREQHIITERRLKEPKTSLQALADHYAISVERVRQIENQALKKLKLGVGALEPEHH